MLCNNSCFRPSIKQFAEVLNLKNSLDSLDTDYLEDNEQLMDALSACNNFIMAYRVTDETDKLTGGEYTRRSNRHYKELKEMRAL